MNLNGPITDVVTQDQQGRWRDVRLGRFTASTFSDLICAKRDKETGLLIPTEKFLTRCASVAAERLTGVEAYSAQTKAMEWGQDMEEKAIELLSELWTEVEGATFVPFGDEFGCTPDGYVKMEEGISTLDVKCPFNSAQFVKFCRIGDTWEDLKDFSPEYAWQIATQARFCGMQLCSIAYVDPRMPENIRAKWRTYALTIELVERIDETCRMASNECAAIMELMQ